MFCRIQSQNPESEMDNYASFINEALDKTKCRECVPCWEEIQTLMNRQKMLCTVHYPGPGSCQLYISSHTTANEVGGHFFCSQLCFASNFQRFSKNITHIMLLIFCFYLQMNLLGAHLSLLPTSRWCGGCRRSSACRTATTHLHCTNRARSGSSQWPAAL